MNDAETHDVMMNIPVWMMTSETRVCCALGAMRRRKRGEYSALPCGACFK